MPDYTTLPDNARLYEECGRVAAVFWEWRHKVMTHFFTFTGAVVVLAGWFYDHPGLRAWFPIPMFLGSLLGIVSYLLDRRVAWVLKECYRVAGQIECDLRSGGAIFHAIAQAPLTMGFHFALRAIYIGTSAAFLLAGISSAIWIE